MTDVAWVFGSCGVSSCKCSSRKGTCETANFLQKDGQQHASGGAPSAFVHSPTQHHRLQVCLRASQGACSLSLLHVMRPQSLTMEHCMQHRMQWHAEAGGRDC